MRDDLTKVLCEQPRPRSGDHYSNYRNLRQFEQRYDDVYDDDEPFTGVGSGHRESMKFRYGYDSKSFGEHLSPLYGVVRKNVGRKWDKVYSELSKSFDRRSATGNHIFQHLFDQLVDPKDTFIGDDGKVWIRPYGGSGAEHAIGSSYEFYVDPRDGILKRNSKYRMWRQTRKQRELKRQIEIAKTVRVVDANTELHQIDGVWFEIKFETIVGDTSTVKASYGTNQKNTWYRTVTLYPPRFDVLLKMTVEKARVAVSKRTICHRDLKRYGLLV